MPSIVQSLVLVFARFINLFPVETIQFLTDFTVENRVGLKVLVDKWLLHQPLMRGNYFRNVCIKALTILFSLKNSIVESLMVIGYDPSHSTASVEINAPLKILSVLIRCLNNEVLQEKIKKERTDYHQSKMNYYDEGRMETIEDNYRDEPEDEENDDKLNVDLNEFKNMEDEEARYINSKLGFLNQQGKTGGLNNIEAGSEIYLSEMLVLKCKKGI